MIKTILANEIEKIISRKPTDEELLACQKYISENTLDTDGLKEIGYAISDWADTEITTCEYCSEWHLIKNMTKTDSKYFCDEICCEDWYEAQNFDPHAEWGTDGRHTC